MFPFRLFITFSSLTPLLVLSQLHKMITYIVTSKNVVQRSDFSLVSQESFLEPF